MSAQELHAAYSALSENVWENTEHRPDFILAAKTVSKLMEQGSVLDIGCYNGDFLALLPDAYEKYGIEPSVKAREKAEKRGVNVVGSNVFELEDTLPKIDCIFMMDVVEHLPNPVAVLERAISLLSPGGLLIASTGNTDSFFWRIARSDYYYYFPEHIAFYNPRWFHWLAKREVLKIVSVHHFSRTQAGIWQKIKSLVLMLMYWFLKVARKYPGLLGDIVSVYPFTKISQAFVSPCGAQWKDHMLIVLEKV